MFDFEDVNHFGDDLLQVPDFSESFFKLVPERLSLIRLRWIFDGISFKFHLLRCLFFQCIFENKLLLFEIVDLRLELIDVHGGALISSARVEYFLFQVVVFVLKLDILFVDRPDSLFELLDFEGHAGEFGFGLVELEFEGGVFREDLVVYFFVLQQLLVFALEFNVVGLEGQDTGLEGFVFFCCLL